MNSIDTYQGLTWSLVIATYRREHILPKCLKLAAEQTWPPKDIVVIDASPNWVSVKESIMKDFEQNHPDIPLIYAKAKFASSSAQRNQGVDLATGDIIFLFDDDSLMYPDCAENVMQVYEADTECAIAGVSARSVPVPPPNVQDTTIQELKEKKFIAQKHPQTQKLRKFVNALFRTSKTTFVPYDERYPDLPIPISVQKLNVARMQTMSGFAMTLRKTIFEQERFSEILKRYGAGEDQDLSYRASRHGSLVKALDAKLCHLWISGGRLSPYQVEVLTALNAGVLQQIYSSDRGLVFRRWKRVLWHRLIIAFVKDLQKRNFLLPRTRGVIYALKYTKIAYTKSLDDIGDWYKCMQADIIDNG